MSNNVDRRVVEMQFDNKDFENNVQTSVKSLDNLKKSLDLEESAKGLSALEKAGRSFNLDGLVDAAEAVTGKFSVMGTIGDQVLRRITDAAMNAAMKVKGFVESLTIQPISTGFEEYETQINSVQTILSNTRDAMTKAGYSDEERLAIVNDRLDQLNYYADKTIYNFTQMTESIGKFTAAGVDLDTSVSAIQGIANLAAVSGSNADQASNAMYMLSQALSSGTVSLYHWNSVVRAGMGGEVFQKELIRTATAMGKTVDVTIEEVNSKGKKVKKTVKKTIAELVEEEGSFRDSLSKGWLTSDILTATLDHFSWDFEQMAKDMGISVEEAIDMKRGELLAQGYKTDEVEEIIQLAKDANEAATKVKTFTQLFDTLKEAAQSGWTQTWRYIIGDFDEAKELLTSISDFFGGIIEASAEARNKIVGEWKELGGRDEMIQGFWNIIYAVQNIATTVKAEFQKIFPPKTGQQLFDMTKRFREFTEKIKGFTENTETMEKFSRVIRGVAAGLDIARTAFGYAWNGFKQLVGFASPASSGLLDFAASLGDAVVKMRDSLKTSEGFQNFLKRLAVVADSVRKVFVQGLNLIYKAFSKLAGKIKESGILTKMGTAISDFVGKIPAGIEKMKDWIKAVINYVKNSEKLKTALANVKAFFAPIIQSLSDFGKRFREGLQALFEKDVSDENTLGGKLKAKLSAFAGAFSDWFVDVRSKVSVVWNNIKTFFTDFFTKTIPNFFNSTKIGTGSLIDTIKGIDWLTVIKTVLGIYGAFKVLSSLGGLKSIGKGLKGIGKSLKGVGKGIEDVVKNGITITQKKKDSLGNTLLKIAASIGILVGSIYVLAKMDTKDVVKGLGIITILAVELLAVSALFSKVSADGKSFLMVAAAITLLVIPIHLLAKMDTREALKGIAAVGIILTELGLFMRLAGKGFTGKTGFIGLSIAVNLLVIAVKNLAGLNTGGMIKSLIGMEVLLLELSAFMKKTAGIGKVSGLIGMAVAVNLLVVAVKRMGSMNAGTIAKGVIGLGGIMTAFSVMAKMTKGMKLGNSLVMLLTMAGSLILFIEAFKQVENMDTESMLRFATSISETMLALSIAMKVISTIPIAGALTGVAAFAILIVGIGGIIAALGWLQSKWSGMTDFLEGGGNVLGQIGRAIGKFVGGIAGGIVEGLNLPQIGTDLSAFMVNAEGFIAGAKTIDGSVVTGVAQLSAALLAIGGTEFVNALVSLFTGENPVTKFSNDLKTLGEGLVGYSNAVAPLADVPEGVIDRSIDVAGALTEVARKVPATGGIISLLSGIGDLGTFSSNIVLLGQGLAAFAVEISAIDDASFNQTKIDAVVSIAAGLAELESNLEGQGGLEDAIEGVKSLGTFSEGMEPFAAGLNAFITEVKAIDFNPDADGEKLTSVIEIGKALADLEKNLEGQGGWEDAIEGVKSLSLFSEGMEPFAEGLNAFISNVKAIDYDIDSDSDKLYAIIQIGETLSALEKSLEGQGGWEDAISGVKSLGSFSEGMEPFADGLNTFISSVQDIEYDPEKDGAKFDAIIKIAQTLSAFEKTLQAKDGFSQSIFGQKDLSQFAVNIESLGTAIASYMTSIQSVDVDQNETTISAMEMIQDFVEGLDPSGSIWTTLEEVFGSGSKFTTLLTYTDSMRQLGEDLNTFATSIEDVSGEKVDYATSIFGVIQDFIGGLEKSGTVWDWFGETFGTGSKFSTLTTAMSNMATFGTHFKTFSDGIENAESASAAFEIAKTLFGAFNDFNTLVSDWTVSSQTDQMYSLLWLIQDYGTSLSAMAMGLGDVDVERLAGAANVINSVASAVSAVIGLPDLSIEPIQTLLDKFSELTIPQFDAEGLEAASAYITNLSDGIQNGADTISSAAVTISNAGSNGADDTYITWYNTGKNLGQGLANGISAMARTIRTSAVNAASGAISAIQVTWSVHSPSRVGMGLGMNWDLGLAGGIDAYANRVAGSSENVAQGAVDSAKTLLRGFDGSIFDYVDPNPTIRPVMDLSSIQSGVGLINGMFDSERMIGGSFFSGMNFNRGVAAMNLDGAKIMGNMNNKELVSEIRALNSRFDELNQAVSNMKVVLDSGELVGATASKIDNNLGTIAMRKGRGN